MILKVHHPLTINTTLTLHYPDFNSAWKHCAALKSCSELCKLWVGHGRLMQDLSSYALPFSRIIWHVALRLSWRCIQKETQGCSPASLLTWTQTVCVYVCFCLCACAGHLFVMCCALLETSGNGRCHPCLLAVKFYEGFCKCEVAVPAVSSTLLQSLTLASKVSLTELQIYCCRTVCLRS